MKKKGSPQPAKHSKMENRTNCTTKDTAKLPSVVQ